MKNISFGQYYPTNSIIHKLDPRAKIFFSLIYMIAIFFIISYTSYIVLFCFILTLTLISKIPFRMILKSIRPVIFISIFTAFINIFFNKNGRVLAEFSRIVITDIGLHSAAKLVLRIVFLVLGTAILTLTTTPTELTDAIEYWLSPLKYIKFPVHDIAIIMSIALRFIPGFIEETDKIIKAQKSRGASFDHGNIFKRIKAIVPILVPLFVSAFGKADDLADALDARCYNATNKRTRYKKLSFALKDLFAFLCVAAIIIFIFLDKFYFKNLDLKFMELFK